MGHLNGDAKMQCSFVFLAVLLIVTPVSRADVFYVPDEIRIAKITQDGAVAEVPLQSNTSVNGPLWIAIDGTGNLFVCNNSNHNVVKILPDGSDSVFIHTATQSNGVATDRFNNVYLSETGGNIIAKVSPQGVATVVTDQVYRPGALAVDGDGNIFCATWDNLLVKVTSSGTVTTLATATGGNQGVALNGDGNVYVSDLVDGSILKVALDGTVTTFATGFDSPQGIAFGSNGDLYVANGTVISEVSPNGIVKNFAAGLVGPTDIAVQLVPEPSTLIISGGCIFGLLICRHSRRQNSALN